jgi:hypothetical protein
MTDETPTDRIPLLLPDLTPPAIRGPAALTHLAYAGSQLENLLAFISRPVCGVAEAAALAFDCGTAHLLNFHPDAARALQRQALHASPLFRVDNAGAQTPGKLRVLGLLAAGDLMANTPLDFITRHLDVQLDLLFVQPGEPLPDAVPDHDVAFFAAADADPATLARLAPLFAVWPRPALNNPARVAPLGREGLLSGLCGRPGLACAPLVRLSRARALAALEACAPLSSLLPGGAFPVLVRPVGSHAGHDLTKADDAAALASALTAIQADEVFLSTFIDYRGRDGMFRKYRVVFVDGAPFLAHVAISERWMVHYLNAGMSESAEKRAGEAAAMASFDCDFARRHAVAFASVTDWAGLDYFQIDCGETADGRLLMFEADVAGIVHTLDPPDLFPYKLPQMRRVIAAFGAMLERHAGRGGTAQAA